MSLPLQLTVAIVATVLGQHDPDCKADIVFAIDNSESVRDFYKDVTSFVSRIHDNLNIGENTVRTSCLDFDNTVQDIFLMSPFDRESKQAKLDAAAVRAGGPTSLHLALRRAKEHLQTARGIEVPKVLVSVSPDLDGYDADATIDAFNDINDMFPNFKSIAVVNRDVLEHIDNFGTEAQKDRVWKQINALSLNNEDYLVEVNDFGSESFDESVLNRLLHRICPLTCDVPKFPLSNPDAEEKIVTGSKVTYTCIEGNRYPPNLDSLMFDCVEVGPTESAYEPTDPFDCTPVPRCSVPQFPTTDHNAGSTVAIGEPVEYRCIGGHVFQDLSKTKTSLCEETSFTSASLKPIPEECVPLPLCDVPSFVNSVHGVSGQVEVNSVVKYSCNEGTRYEDGSELLTTRCVMRNLELAELEPTPVDCEPICTVNDFKHNSNDAGSDYVQVDSEVTYTCDANFVFPVEHTSSKTSICTKLGESSAGLVPPPTDCIEIPRCQLKSDFPNSEHNRPSENSIQAGESVKYTCLGDATYQGGVVMRTHDCVQINDEIAEWSPGLQDCRKPADPNEFCQECSSNRWNQKQLYGPLDEACPTYFYQCERAVDGSWNRHRHNCSTGLYWRGDILQCAPMYKGTCDDPCRIPQVQHAGKHMGDLDAPADNCASYWACSNYISYHFCCPDWMEFDPPSLECILSATCDRTKQLACRGDFEEVPFTHPPIEQQTDGTCSIFWNGQWITVQGNTGDVTFEQSELVDGTLIKEIHNCPPGSAYDETTCYCSMNIGVTAPVDALCPLILDVCFTILDSFNELYDKSEWNYYVHCTDHKAIAESNGALNGVDYCTIPGLMTHDLREGFAIELDFEYQNGGPLVNNEGDTSLDLSSHPGVKWSVNIRVENDALIAEIRSTLQEIANAIVPVDPNVPLTAFIIYCSGALSVEVTDGVETVLANDEIAPANVAWMHHCPWAFGHRASSGSVFDGSIQSVKLFKGCPCPP